MIKLFRSSLITIGSFAFVVTIVSAWSSPEAAPPNNNVPTPINVSLNNQIKEGGLGVASLLVSGGVQINGKATSASTGEGDSANTLVTKDYVDSLLSDSKMIYHDSGKAYVIMTNGQKRSSLGHVYFGPQCANTLTVVTQSSRDSIACGNASGPITCVSDPGASSVNLHAYASNVTGSGFDLFLSASDGIWLGTTNPYYEVDWIATCDNNTYY